MATPELEQALHYLEENVPAVGGCVSSVATAAAGYLALVQAFGKALGERREPGTGMFDGLRQALAGYQQQVDETDRGFEDLMKDTEAARESAVDMLSEEMLALQAAVTEAEGALAALQGAAVALGEGATRTSKDCQTAASALATTLTAAESGLEARLSVAVARTGALEKAIATAQSEVAEPAAQAARKIAAIVPDAESHMADLDARITRLMASLPSHYEPTGELASAAKAVAAEYRLVADGFLEELETLTKEIADARDAVAGTIDERLEAWGAARDVADEQAKAMETNRQPLPDAVTSVRGAAAHNGVAFGA
jgi:hypothetical protein